jgi:hypothetical protein
LCVSLLSPEGYLSTPDAQNRPWLLDFLESG